MNDSCIRAQNNPLPIVSVSGNRFVLPDGQTMLMRGLAIAEPFALVQEQLWNAGLFRKAAEWGANVVRIPIGPRCWMIEGEQTYFSLLDQAVKWAEKFGLYIVLDWHAIGDLVSGTFINEGCTTSVESTLAFWRAATRRYADTSIVAAYEIFNEPTDHFSSSSTLSWKDWYGLATAIIETIRRIDANTVVIVGGIDWAYDLSGARDLPLPFSNVAYAVHPYPQKTTEPFEENWEKHWGFLADSYPLFATEFGYMAHDDPGAHVPCIAEESERYGERILNYFDRKGISWTAWCFHPRWQPNLVDERFRPIPGRGEIIRSALEAFARSRFGDEK